MNNIKDKIKIGLLALPLLAVPTFALADKHDDKPTIGEKVKANANEAGNEITDTWITTKVKTKLEAEKATRPFSIEVNTQDKVVSLSGEVPTQRDKRNVVKFTKSIEGVKSVISDTLKVRS